NKNLEVTMAAKPRFRFPLFPVLARPRGTRPAAIIAIATAIGFLTLASPSLAATGSVYVDANSNVGAGHDFFSGTTPVGEGNVGLGYHVMPALTSGGLNVAIGTDALNSIATGSS